MADEIDPGRSDPRDVRSEVEMLLRGHYTMDSERIVHGLFDDSDPSGSGFAGPPVEAADTLDDCFL
ncbi:MAG: hypothetical protein NVV74_17275 [Magnetospirillum sp.]|nr:hypothetical protein [Magnetospirillum sp.]